MGDWDVGVKTLTWIEKVLKWVLRIGFPVLCILSIAELTKNIQSRSVIGVIVNIAALVILADGTYGHWTNKD